MTIDRYAHLVGGARMAARAEDGVVDADHRVFGVPNLYVIDGSVLPTQGSANPALTIMALAARAADRLAAGARAGRLLDAGGADEPARAVVTGVSTGGVPLPHPGPEADGTLDLGRDDRRRRCRSQAGGAPGWGGPTAARRRPPWSPSTWPACSPAATRSTCRAPGRRCTGPAATWAPAACSARRSAPSTSRCGTSRPGCSDMPLADLLGEVRDRVPVYGSGGFTTLVRGGARRTGRRLARSRLHRDEDQDRRVVGHRARPRPRPGPAAARARRGRRRADGRRQRRLHHRPGPPGGRASSTSSAWSGSRSR